MVMPPNNEAPDELFQRLSQPRPTEIVDFPRRDPKTGKFTDKIRIKVLPQSAQDQARIRAHETFKKKGFTADDLKSITMREVLGDAVAKELLTMACLTAKAYGERTDTGEPIYAHVFKSADALSDVLTSDELGVLFNMYLMIRDKYGPSEHDPDTEEWIKRLMEGGSGFPLLSLSLPDLVRLASSFADRVYSISRILESQWETLPDTLKSDLAKFSLGTGFWSSPLDELQQSKDISESLGIEDGIGLGTKTRAIENLTGLLDHDE